MSAVVLAGEWRDDGAPTPTQIQVGPTDLGDRGRDEKQDGAARHFLGLTRLLRVGSSSRAQRGSQPRPLRARWPRHRFRTSPRR